MVAETFKIKVSVNAFFPIPVILERLLEFHPAGLGYDDRIHGNFFVIEEIEHLPDNGNVGFGRF